MTFPQVHRGDAQKVPSLKRFLPRRSSCGGQDCCWSSVPPSILEDGNSRAAVLCLFSLPTAQTFLGIVLNWSNFKKLAVGSQHCTGFSCLTWEGVIRMGKGCILLYRYFCEVNETPCSGLDPQELVSFRLLEFYRSCKKVGGKNVAF